MYFVYVIKLRNGIFYKGLTDNIDRRLKQHEYGQVKTTKNHLPISVIHVELAESRTIARKLEKYFKSGFGREIIKELDQD